MEMIDTIVIIAIVIGILSLLLLLFAILVCINRRRKNIKKNKNKKNTAQKEGLLQNDKTKVSNVSETTKKPSDEADFNGENYKYFGVSFNEIPFIDDSKYNSYADLSWNPNPYKQLINTIDA